MFCLLNSYNQYGRLQSVDRGMGYEETFTKSKDPDGAIVTKTTTILGKEFTTRDSAAEGIFKQICHHSGLHFKYNFGILKDGVE